MLSCLLLLSSVALVRKSFLVRSWPVQSSTFCTACSLLLLDVLLRFLPVVARGCSHPYGVRLPLVRVPLARCV